jgi:hypothetical protein
MSACKSFIYLLRLKRFQGCTGLIPVVRDWQVLINSIIGLLFFMHCTLCTFFKNPLAPPSLSQILGLWVGNGKYYAQCCSTTKHAIQNARFISLSCDEITTVDNQSWILIHCYVVQNWHKVPIFLNLQKIIEGSGSDNLTTMHLNSIAIIGGLS